MELFDDLEDWLRNEPESCGERHPGFPDHQFYVWESPDIARLPKVRVFYEIVEEEREVILWATNIT